MKVLVIGGGGREHALVWKIAQSPMVTRLYCAPGNPGIAALAECVNIAANDIDALQSFAREQNIDLTVVGPEDPLARGIVDHFESSGLRAFGPSRPAARLESSKAFAKSLMVNHGIPTGRYAKFGDPAEAKAYVREQGAPIVVKADGLAAGKGVTVAQTEDEAMAAIDAAMTQRVFGDAGSNVIVEECLCGEEASILAFTDGASVIPMAPSQDHKAVFNGDTGPNTGGMGAYSPAPVITDALLEEVTHTILEPCVHGMARGGTPYRGVLYAGLMITESGPKVIEFNCRFGDPETQVVLPRMRSDLVPALVACCEGTLDRIHIEWDTRACVSVVMASGGYPGPFDKGFPIHGIDDAERGAGVVVFHAGTKLVDGEVVTNGGRVLNVTALGNTIPDAIARAYDGADRISFEKAHYRTDIGKKALARLKF